MHVQPKYRNREIIADNEKKITKQDKHLNKRNTRDSPRFLGWTLARWLLLVTNILLFVYGTLFLGLSIATYTRSYERAIVILVANKDILGVTFAASLLCVITSILGFIGILYKNRKLLAIYSLMLWVCFALIATAGYIGFKTRTWNLKAKLGVKWRHDYSVNERELIQDNLHCCGFDNPSDHAAYFSRCWAHSLLPGCQYKFYVFENTFLLYAYTAAFTVLPCHILVIIVSILCSNHVEHVFGNRKRPPIPYLGGFKNWREWELANKPKTK